MPLLLELVRGDGRHQVPDDLLYHPLLMLAGQAGPSRPQEIPGRQKPSSSGSLGLKSPQGPGECSLGGLQPLDGRSHEMLIEG